MIKIEVADEVSPVWTRTDRERLQVRVAKQHMRKAPLMNSTQRRHEKQEERAVKLVVATNKAETGNDPYIYSTKISLHKARFLLSLLMSLCMV